MAFAPAEKDFRPSPNGHVDLNPPSRQRSLWYEIIPVDPAWLLPFHPVYRGEGIARGDGSPVMFVPGLSGSDGHMEEMHNWAIRIGYMAVRSGIIWNRDPWRHMEGMVSRLEKAVLETGQKATVAGWSLGGIYAEVVGIFRPDLVHTIITMGTDTRTNIRKDAHPAIRAFGTALIEVDKFSEEMLDALPGMPIPEGVKMYCIYGSADGAFHKEDFGDPRATENIEVSSKHGTYPWNPFVYEHVGRILAKGARNGHSTS
ncbi:MAG: hypothetical protein A2629_01905 [Candidatus Levybacteria bacterium RIFCSPHIGHO2_01_FULL_41_15]|nr:MAG: hypothetical protein A2629_01905 [Candidatus Levybacteria bacterium RIFCSPHIGHO2_01_FULL_41_15]